MRICFAMIDVADVVTFLPGWQESRGANVEWSYACYCRKCVIGSVYAEDWATVEV